MALEDAKDEVDRAITATDLRGMAFENVFAGVPSFLRRRYSKDLAGVDLAITGGSQAHFGSLSAHPGRRGLLFRPADARE